MDFAVVSDSAEETIRFGQNLGTQLRGGEVIALVGSLGSGKTHLIKGIAAGLGAVDAAKEVSSPTFVLVNEYAGRLDIFHIDAYRISSLSEFEQVGFDDYCYLGSVVLIEWADKVEQALAGINYIRIELAHLGPDRRSIRISSAPEYIRF